MVEGGRRRGSPLGISIACFYVLCRFQNVSNTCLMMVPKYQNYPRRNEVYRVKILLEGGGAGEGRV